MDKLEEYKIPIQSLDDGVHKFNFKIGSAFMKLMKSEQDFKGKLNVDLKLDKLNRTYTFDFHIHGTIGFPCDRCLENVNIEIDELKQIFGKVVSEIENDGDGEIIFFDEDEVEYNFAKLIFEFIVLSMPMKKVHPDDENGNSTCNSEILEKLEKINKSEEGHDPRWDALKKLKDNK